MKTRKNMNKIIIISILVIALFLITMVAVTAYIHRQPDNLLAIQYVCTTGLKPNAFSAYRVYDNGTHTIDMDSCEWIENINYP